MYTDFEKLPAKVRTSVIELERATAECTGFLVNICLSYGSRAEIIMACNSAIAEKQQQRRIKLSGQLESLEPTASPIFSEVSDVTAVPMFDDAASLDSSTAATDSYERIEIRPQENKRLRETSPATESVIDNEKFHSSSSSCCGAGGSSSDFSVDSRHLSTNRSSCAQESHSHSLSLDEETLSRHMCTANIPGDLCVLSHSAAMNYREPKAEIFSLSQIQTFLSAHLENSEFLIFSYGR